MLIYLDETGELLVSNYDDPTGYIFNQVPYISGNWVYSYSSDLQYHTTMLNKTFNLTKWGKEQALRIKQAKLLGKL